MLTPQNAWLPRCATCHLPPPPPQRVREDRRKAPSPPPPSHGAYLQADQSRFGNPSHDSIRSETALRQPSIRTYQRRLWSKNPQGGLCEDTGKTGEIWTLDAFTTDDARTARR